MILLLFLLAASMLGPFIGLYHHLKAGERAMNATFDHCDLGDKILDMLQDPSTTPEEWKELLAIAHYADQRFAETHPLMSSNCQQAELIRKILA